MNSKSRAYANWRKYRQSQLDDVRQAHVLISGSRPVRPYATRQINHAYLIMLAAQFQGFCRELHTECVDHLLFVLSPPAPLRPLLRAELTRSRLIDRGNAQPGSLGTDFKRLTVDLWSLLRSYDTRTDTWHNSLETLNRWRNAIAHQDFSASAIGGVASIDMRRISTWRSHCDLLARSMDRVLHDHLMALTQAAPW